MKSHILKAAMALGIFLATTVMAADKFPTQEPMGGETFGHSVTSLGKGLYVFRWWIYRNLFVVTDEGVIVTDPMNPKAAKLLQGECELDNRWRFEHFK